MGSYADKLIGQADAHFRVGRAPEAEAALVRVLGIEPRNGKALLLLGNVRMWRGDDDGAIETYSAAIAANPRDVASLNNLGTVLRRRGRLAEAADALSRAVAVDPRHADALTNLGSVYQDRGLLQESIDVLQRALAIKPGSVIAFNNLLLSLNRSARATPREVYEAHVEFGRRFAAGVPVGASFANDRTPGRVIRVGYVSPDLRQHSVRHFVEPILRHHDWGRVHVTCYSTGRGDAATERLKALADGWFEARGWTDEAMANRVRQDGMDILVDLAGHTSARVLTFARRAAPVQITYLGYPNTTGLAAMDYRITDAIADPPGEADGLHTERLLRLPACAWCYQPPEDAPAVAVRDLGSPVTFGSLNALSKLTDETVALWSRVLLAVPGARLVLKARGLTDPATRELTRSRFVKQRVGAERVEALAWAESTADHLAVYHQIDVGLDPYPYHGTTTTCEALYMGVPVVTLTGRVHAARVGTSLLSAVGLGELAASGEEAFVTTAARLVEDREGLAKLRAGLRERVLKSPLCDGGRFTKELEAVYETVWGEWCQRGN